ncbi:unnamed protein product [Caenorhabditis brenneri]
MDSDKAFVHQKVPFLLERQNWRDRRISQKAVAGLVLYGRRLGGYNNHYGHRIMFHIQQLIRRGNLNMEEWLFDEIEQVVVCGSRQDAQTKNRIIVTADMARGMEELESFKKSRTKEPLYVDTEDSHNWLRDGHYRELALITIFDAGSQTVLLFRVHRFDEFDLEEIQDQIRALSEFRTFASYGVEDFFSFSNNIEVEDLQDLHDDGCLVSLKTAARSIGILLDKEETISDWTAPRLTNDQILPSVLRNCRARFNLVHTRQIPVVPLACRTTRITSTKYVTFHVHRHYCYLTLLSSMFQKYTLIFFRLCHFCSFSSSPLSSVEHSSHK